MSRRCWLVVAILFSIAFIIVACNPNPQPPGLTPVPTLAPGATVTLVPSLREETLASGQPVPPPSGESASALGAHIFLENCTPCHGVQGEGVDAPALRNNDYVQTAGDQALFMTVAEGRTGTEMPAWLQLNGGPLQDGDITDVVAYLHTLQGLPPVPPTEPKEEAPEPTPEPGAPPARPSLPGGPGPAASLSGEFIRGQPAFGLYCAPCHGPEGVQGIPNPGSDDGAVPELDPIDPTIVNPDLAVFAENVDLFIEHGSVPEGENPRIMMPSFGDTNMLDAQQIADLIAYVIHLNEEQPVE